MIKEGRKLPPLVTDRIPVIIEKVSKDAEVVALFSFGSLAKDALKPLSDLDFAVLVSKRVHPETRFKKHLQLIGLFNHASKVVVTWRSISLLLLSLSGRSRWYAVATSRSVIP